ncbi:hypothetical protein M409DRAFT_28239 [Zasmidium cellare ATCC 36951]|uniref:Uncharacterized protein n=1 Tax=Zasmidium cellare ATCC 36951 TaxID=1080233 RepID=A0A6A6C6K4_ZASCE|nr:uncharacterized protein M409DRAFT_28239 [Zasmidium cellare ATCC 36951]KAF2161512.1 hypothetical protein M409DRAFT_28239 [Zasmidium cellare ATCC 36951]
MSRFDMQQYLGPASIRLFGLSITVITARHLFEDGFHVPTFLSLAHVTIALVCKALFQSKNEARDPNEHRQHSLTSFAWLLVYTASITGALICAYQSLLHTKNTTLWMMILSLHWDSLLPEDARSLLERSSSTWLVEILRYTTFAICVALLFLQDHHMTNEFEYLTLGAAGCMVIAKRSFEEAREVSFAGWGAHTFALAVSLVPILAFMAPNEWKNSGDFALYGHLGLLLLNLPAGAAVLYDGAAVSQAADDEDEHTHISEHSGLDRICVAVCLVVLTALDNLLFQSRPTMTTIGQWVAFVVALLATMDFESALVQWEQLKLPWIRHPWLDNVRQIRLPSEDHEDEDEDHVGEVHDEHTQSNESIHYSTWLPLAFQSMLNALVWLLVLHAALMNRKFDTSYSQNSSRPPRLDIVIARYEEPIETVADAVHSILQIPKIAAMNTTVLIYNKGSDIDISSRFPLASDVIVSPRKNVGREGETFLSHLLNESYSFADHTLFMQAEPHELHWLVARIRQYFIQNTDFLSLSYTGSFCSACDRCWDISGWHEGSIVKDIFEQTNPDEDCSGISLTYRAQFIASRARMERINRGTVEHIRERLVGNDAFGFSLERLWGMIFGCPSISSSCPSLWSGQMGIFAPGGAGDCQCLDSEQL